MRVIQEQTTDEPQPIDPELKTDTKVWLHNECWCGGSPKALAKEIVEGKVTLRVEGQQLFKVNPDATQGQQDKIVNQNPLLELLRMI